MLVLSTFKLSIRADSSFLLDAFAILVTSERAGLLVQLNAAEERCGHTVV